MSVGLIIRGELVAAAILKDAAGDKKRVTAYTVRDDEGQEFEVLDVSNDVLGKKGQQVELGVRASVRKGPQGSLVDQVSFFNNSQDRAPRKAPEGFEAEPPKAP